MRRGRVCARPMGGEVAYYYREIENSIFALEGRGEADGRSERDGVNGLEERRMT